jgi:DUF2934 family protein
MPKKNADSPERPGSATPQPPSRPRAPRARTTAGNGDPSAPHPSHIEIAEAAYHRYLNRGGTDGRDVDDWIEAERELRAQKDSR